MREDVRSFCLKDGRGEEKEVSESGVDLTWKPAGGLGTESIHHFKPVRGLFSPDMSLLSSERSWSECAR